MDRGAGMTIEQFPTFLKAFGTIFITIVVVLGSIGLSCILLDYINNHYGEQATLFVKVGLMITVLSAFAAYLFVKSNGN